MTADNAAAELTSWTIALRAARRSPNTIKAYLAGVRIYLAWCAANGLDEVLDRRSVQAWLASLVDAGAEASTVSNRQAAVRAYSAWLADEPDVDHVDHLRGLPPVKVDAKHLPALSDAQLTALLKACAGSDLNDRRDTAALRLMIDTGARADEVVHINLVDLDVANGWVLLTKTKGGRQRRVPFGPTTAQALDRYIRVRRASPHGGSPALFVGRNPRLSYEGLRDALAARARSAGVDGFHLHRLRRTAITRWLDAGGSEGGAVAMAGWRNRNMLETYTAASAERRLGEERARLDLPEL